MIDNYSRVRLLTSDYASEGLSAGDLGYIIEVYDNAYEVEFSDKEGSTIAQIVAQPGEIQVAEPEQPMPRPAKGGAPELTMMTTEYIPDFPTGKARKNNIVSE